MRPTMKEYAIARQQEFKPNVLRTMEYDLLPAQKTGADVLITANGSAKV